MLFGYFTLFVALMISAVAEFYSIVGLTAIFSAAFWPVVIMGACLGVGKVTAAVWLKLNWERAGWTYKLYLVPAVVFLMLLTSMGIFGYLSKAHSDQSLVSGDVVSKIAIYDEKIRTAKDNIDANRKALKQMDEAVDQVMGRSSDEKGADKAVQIRRSQQKERARLQSEIASEQKIIAAVSKERAPIAAEVRKVEAEVGPIKYIAALLYGDNPDNNLLERAVRWMIIMIVLVFDPLALVLILAAQQSLRWAQEEQDAPKYEPDDGPLTDKQVEQLEETVELSKDPHPPGWMFDKLTYLKDGAGMFFKNTKPMVADPPEPVNETVYVDPPPDWGKTPITDVERPGDYLTDQLHDEESPEDTPELRAAKSLWKEQNPSDTLKNQRVKLAKGLIPELPWITMIKETHSGFGTMFPVSPSRGDTFVKTDCLPTQMYKFNGNDWILIDKSQIDNYNYDTAYIDHLISKISTGEYDPELLTEGESAQVAERLNQK
jgi:hypothetical protein